MGPARSEAAAGSQEAEDRETVFPVPESFLPSLHLSVANGYRRLGDLERARRHVLFGSRHIGALSDDAYRNLVKGRIASAARRRLFYRKSMSPAAR